tara:strand:+ start:9638 stop:14254 length:4617 start_codon:yes stop_codon:yes gene_type:complete
MGDINVSLTQGDKFITVPISYVKYKNEENNVGYIWYETMSIATVVEHNGELFKLRMPTAKDQMNNRLQVTLANPTSISYAPGRFLESTDGGYKLKRGEYVKDKRGKYKYVPPHTRKGAFEHRVPNLVNFKRTQLEKGSHEVEYINEEETPINNLVNVKYMDPAHRRGKSTQAHSYNLNSESIDCFAFELQHSSHYINYIGGKWLISFANPLKFFTNDSRLSQREEIAKKLKEIEDKNQRICFYVARKDVDALIGAACPKWLEFNDTRTEKINRLTQFFNKDQIFEIITDFMESAGNNYYSVYEPTFLESREYEKLKQGIRKKLSEIYHQYVSLRPVWDTKERFDNVIIGAGFKQTNDGVKHLFEINKFYEQLEKKIQKTKNKVRELSSDDDDDDDDDGEDDDDDGEYFYADSGTKSDDDDDDASADQTTSGRNFSIPYKKLSEIAESVWKYAIDYLNTKNEDGFGYRYGVRDAFPKWFLKPTDTLYKRDFEDYYTKLNGYTESYVTLLFEELKILPEDQDDILKNFWGVTNLDAKKSLNVDRFMKTMAKQANSKPRKFQLFTNLVQGTGVTTMSENPKDVRIGLEDNLKQAKQQLKKASATNNKKLQEQALALKKQLNAIKDPRWLYMKDVLIKAGINAQNKAAGKPNIVFTFDEFTDMIDRFANFGDPKHLELVSDIDAQIKATTDEQAQKSLKEKKKFMENAIGNYDSRDFMFLVKFAKYIKSALVKARGNEEEKIIKVLSELYSNKNSSDFKKEMLAEIDAIAGSRTWETEWFKSHDGKKEVNRQFHNYLEALVSIHFITDDKSTDDQFDARSTPRTNGIPIALRYAMHLDGVHPSKLNEKTFESLKKFKKEIHVDQLEEMLSAMERLYKPPKTGKNTKPKQWYTRTELKNRMKIKDAEEEKFQTNFNRYSCYNTDFLFETKGDRQQGLYDNVGSDYNSQERIDARVGDLKEKKYSAFHENATSILNSWKPNEDYKPPQVVTKMSRGEPVVVSSGDDAPIRGRQHRARLQKLMLANELTLANNDGGGDCFYHALKDGMSLDITAADLRSQVVIKLEQIILSSNVDYITSMQERLGKQNPALDEDSSNLDVDTWTTMNDLWQTALRKYYTEQATPGTWVDDNLIVSAAAAFFNRPIYIFYDRGSSQKRVEIIRPPTEIYDYDNFIILGLYEGQHYVHGAPKRRFTKERLMTTYFRESMKYRLSSGPSYMSPTQKQRGNDCGIYALNNLNVYTYEIDDLKMLFGRCTNWQSSDMLCALGDKIKKVDTIRADAKDDKNVCSILLRLTNDIWANHAAEILNMKGLMGMVFYMKGSTEVGHWTAMRVEKRVYMEETVDFFTYSDSLKPFQYEDNNLRDLVQDLDCADSEINFAHTVSMNAKDMVEYLNGNLYNNNQWDTAILVFRTPKDLKNYSKKVTKFRKDDAGGAEDEEDEEDVEDEDEEEDEEDEEDDDLSKLMEVYMRIIVPNVQYTVLHPGYETWKKTISGELPRIWREIAEIIKEENPDNSTTIEELAKALTNSRLELKIKCLTKHLRNPADS